MPLLIIACTFYIRQEPLRQVHSGYPVCFCCVTFVTLGKQLQIPDISENTSGLLFNSVFKYLFKGFYSGRAEETLFGELFHDAVSTSYRYNDTTFNPCVKSKIYRSFSPEDTVALRHYKRRAQ